MHADRRAGGTLQVQQIGARGHVATRVVLAQPGDRMLAGRQIVIDERAHQAAAQVEDVQAHVLGAGQAEGDGVASPV